VAPLLVGLPELSFTLLAETEGTTTIAKRIHSNNTLGIFNI
jgi:hypothetical protein